MPQVVSCTADIVVEFESENAFRAWLAHTTSTYVGQADSNTLILIVGTRIVKAIIKDSEKSG